MSTRVLLCAAGLFWGSLNAAPIAGYLQTNLVSNIPGLAAFTDANLKNPWGMAASATSPMWIADEASGKSTLYNTAGVPQGLVVSTQGAPTGIVFNGTSAFNSDLFLFASLDGSISGWRGALGTTAETLQLADPNNSYTGLALSTTASGTYLLAANGKTGNVDVLKSTGAPDLAGKFLDPTLPAGYVPYNIQLLSGVIYVTYKGAGVNGIVDRFDVNGNLLGRFITNGALNSPWGLALAPSSGFGPLSGALLVGNQGDGKINAYDSTTGALLGTLADTSGNPLVNGNLWGLRFGNGGNGGNTNTLYFTAGINGQVDGLYGSIAFAPVPEPSTFVLLSAGLALAGIRFRRRQNSAAK